MNVLDDINAGAHLVTVNPWSLPWRDAGGEADREMISRFTYEDAGHASEGAAYVVKELVQLSDIESHVAAVMASVLCELPRESRPLARSSSLDTALSTFAAEELHHSGMFRRYTEILAGEALRLDQNLAEERLALYRGNDAPYVKIAALVASAYPGESLFTVFSRRFVVLDPSSDSFCAQLVRAHDVDESRHIQFDHLVFDQIVPALSPAEFMRMMEILKKQIEYNLALSDRYAALVGSRLGVDFVTGNYAHATQMRLAQAFASRLFGPKGVSRVDDIIDGGTADVLRGFSGSPSIHLAA